MKQLAFILVLGFGLSFSCHAQYFFNKRNALNSYYSILTSVVPRDGLYFCTGLCWDSINYSGPGQAYYREGVKFAIFDSLGNKIRDTVYQQNNRNFEAWNNSLYPLPDKGFLLALGFDYDSIHRKAMIIRYDSGGNVLWTKEFSQPICSADTIFYRVTDFKPTGTGEWLMTATLQCIKTQADIVLTKLDSNFNEIWSKVYGDTSLNDIAGKIVIVPDGYIFCGWRENMNMVQANYICRAEIIKTDTSGSQLWIWQSDPGKKTGLPWDIIRTKDGGYLYCGQGNGIELSVGGGGLMEWDGWIEKLDSNRNVLWDDTISISLPTSGDANNQYVLKELSDGGIIVAGEVIGGFDSIDFTSERYGYGSLIKYSPNGTKLWKRKYNYNEDTTLIYTVRDMKPTTDGGFVFCGEATAAYQPKVDPYQRGWIVKVDSNGCLGPSDPQCWPVHVPNVENVRDVKIYPNPTTEQLNMETSITGTVMVFNLFGQLMFESTFENKTQISTKDWSTGIYMVQIIDGMGNRLVRKVVKE